MVLHAPLPLPWLSSQPGDTSPSGLAQPLRMPYKSPSTELTTLGKLHPLTADIPGSPVG